MTLEMPAEHPPAITVVLDQVVLVLEDHPLMPLTLIQAGAGRRRRIRAVELYLAQSVLVKALCFC
jgi:hypothetical protein